MLDFHGDYITINAHDLEEAWGNGPHEWGLLGSVHVDEEETFRMRPGGLWTWERQDEDGEWFDTEHDVKGDDIATLCRDLDDLKELLEVEGAIEALDMAGLPTFGGPEPEDTMGIYSWDEARVMYIEGDITFAERWTVEFPDADEMEDEERLGLVRGLRGEGRHAVAEQIRELIEDDELRAALKVTR